MAFNATEDALRAWIKSASGFADENIRWSNQKVEYPAGPFVELHITAVPPLGAYDPVTSNYDVLRAPGVEIELVVEGSRELNLSVQVHRAPVVGGVSAVALATKLALGVRLPSVNAALNEAGVAPFDIGAVQDQAALLGTSFNGRATFDARFYIKETVSEFTTYISRAEMTESLTGQVFVIQEE